MSSPATLSRLFTHIETDLEAVDVLFRERARSEVALLDDASLQVMASQGKRLRTALTLLAGRLFSYHRERLVPLSAGFEMLHLASLVHDDIIDKATTRRGLPTVNSRFGNDIAILLGDFYFARTAGLIADVNDNRVDRLFAETVATLVEGTMLETLEAGHLDLSYSAYLKKISGKTACLIAACCKGGAMVCEATDEQIAQITTFGQNLGIAFQIIDDVLDYSGTEAIIGKPAGNDLRQGMVTLPLIYSLEGDGGNHLATVRAIIEAPQQHEEMVAPIVAWVRNGNGLQAALRDALMYAQQARDLLFTFPASPDRDILEEIIDFVLQRER